jgi:hypothetical protein
MIVGAIFTCICQSSPTVADVSPIPRCVFRYKSKPKKRVLHIGGFYSEFSFGRKARRRSPLRHTSTVLPS